MKDIEKIKSEDLAAQVQDANPANFAIEQEVAQLVGATVPQPTEPSADDARELGAQLLVFLRRALLPIRSALRTAVAAIYAHLDSRCTDYTPAAYAPYQPLPSYDPMGTPPTPRTLPNLLTALTAFAPRKISNGSAPSDGIPDGVSLAHLLMDSTIEVTELKDDNHGWVLRRALPTMPSCKKVTLGCKSMPIVSLNPFANASNVEEAIFTDLEALDNRTYEGYNSTSVFTGSKWKKLEFPKLTTLHCNNMNGRGFFYDITGDCEILMPNCTYAVTQLYTPRIFTGCSGVRRLVLGKLEAVQYLFSSGGGYTGSEFTNLIDFEIGEGTAINLPFGDWNPSNVLSDADKTATFLQNFKNHIALRLTANGSGKTLTLSQAVRNAIHAAEATYGIEAIIVTQKGWTLSPAPTA